MKGDVGLEQPHARDLLAVRGEALGELEPVARRRLVAAQPVDRPDACQPGRERGERRTTLGEPALPDSDRLLERRIPLPEDVEGVDPTGGRDVRCLLGHLRRVHAIPAQCLARFAVPNQRLGEHVQRVGSLDSDEGRVRGSGQHLDPFATQADRLGEQVPRPGDRRRGVERARQQQGVTAPASEIERLARPCADLLVAAERPRDPEPVECQMRAQGNVRVRDEAIRAVEQLPHAGLLDRAADARHPGRDLDRSRVASRGAVRVADPLGGLRRLDHQANPVVAAKPAHRDLVGADQDLDLEGGVGRVPRRLLEQLLGASRRPPLQGIVARLAGGLERGQLAGRRRNRARPPG